MKLTRIEPLSREFAMFGAKAIVATGALGSLVSDKFDVDHG